MNAGDDAVHRESVDSLISFPSCESMDPLDYAECLMRDLSVSSMKSSNKHSSSNFSISNVSRASRMSRYASRASSYFRFPRLTLWSSNASEAPSVLRNSVESDQTGTGVWGDFKQTSSERLGETTLRPEDITGIGQQETRQSSCRVYAIFAILLTVACWICIAIVPNKSSSNVEIDTALLVFMTCALAFAAISFIFSFSDSHQPCRMLSLLSALSVQLVLVYCLPELHPIATTGHFLVVHAFLLTDPGASSNLFFGVAVSFVISTLVVPFRCPLIEHTHLFEDANNESNFQEDLDFGRSDFGEFHEIRAECFFTEHRGLKLAWQNLMLLTLAAVCFRIRMGLCDGIRSIMRVKAFTQLRHDGILAVRSEVTALRARNDECRASVERLELEAQNQSQPRSQSQNVSQMARISCASRDSRPSSQRKLKFITKHELVQSAFTHLKQALKKLVKENNFGKCDENQMQYVAALNETLDRTLQVMIDGAGAFTPRISSQTSLTNAATTDNLPSASDARLREKVTRERRRSKTFAADELTTPLLASDEPFSGLDEVRIDRTTSALSGLEIDRKASLQSSDSGTSFTGSSFPTLIGLRSDVVSAIKQKLNS